MTLEAVICTAGSGRSCDFKRNANKTTVCSIRADKHMCDAGVLESDWKTRIDDNLTPYRREVTPAEVPLYQRE